MSPAVIDSGEKVLGTRNFPTTRAGYRAMLSWTGQSGELARIGVEGTGSYGAGLTRRLAKAGAMILEVDQPTSPISAAKARTTTLTRLTQPASPFMVGAPASRNPRTAQSRHCGYCA